jgi:hypothetical protein
MLVSAILGTLPPTLAGPEVSPLSPGVIPPDFSLASLFVSSFLLQSIAFERADGSSSQRREANGVLMAFGRRV